MLDTSILVAREVREVAIDLESGSLISIMTIAELEQGVWAADDRQTRVRRRRTLRSAERSYPVVPFSRRVAGRYGEIVANARRDGRRPSVSDAVIAATALEFGLPVVTQDADFLAFAGLDVVLV